MCDIYIQIGAPPEVVARLEEINASVAAMGGGSASTGEDRSETTNLSGLQ